MSLASSEDDDMDESQPLRHLILQIYCHKNGVLATSGSRDGLYTVNANWDCMFLEVFEHPGFEYVSLCLHAIDPDEAAPRSKWWTEEAFEKLCSVLTTYPFQTFKATFTATGKATLDLVTEFWKRSQFPGRILEALSSNRSLDDLTLCLLVLTRSRDSISIKKEAFAAGKEEEAFAAVNGSSALRTLLRPHSTLSTLSFQNWPLNDCEIAFLASALANNSPPLKTFGITYTSITIQYEGFLSLLASFATNATVRSFSLTSFFAYNRWDGYSYAHWIPRTALLHKFKDEDILFKDEGMPIPPDVASTFAFALSKNTTLQSLKFGGSFANSAGKILSSNTAVQNLSLISGSFERLDEVVQDNKTLTSLTLKSYPRHNSLMQAEVMRIIKALEKNTTLASIS